MKKILLTFGIFASLQVNAQNYLIAFTGSGASNTVSLVKVENLTTRETLTLNGTDILNLKGNAVITGIDDKNIKSGIKIYPNPMIDNATIEVYPPVSGNATISIFDISGKQVVQIQSYLENSLQEFRLSGEGKGLYIVNIRGNNYQLSGKLICNSNNNGILTIEKVNDSQIIDKDVSKMRFKSTFSTVNMQYTEGDKLKFTGVSGSYELIKTDIINSNKTIEFNFTVCKDADNNNYETVEIDNRTWLAENLKTTKYNDGSNIPYSWKLDSTNNRLYFDTITTPGYVWYNDSIKYKNPNGAIYNWFTVNTGKLCPTGWHVPTVDEWKSMKDYLVVNRHTYADGSSDVAKSIASQSGWIIPQPFEYRGHLLPVIEGNMGKNQATNNSTGFNGYPSGVRHFYGFFTNIGRQTVWLSATGNNGAGWDFSIVQESYWGGDGLGQGSDLPRCGFSVRCIKN
jgi:uncharacterized protein (TIGR02145 family)